MNVGSISLFSGCGGMDIGSIKAGVPVILSTDFDENCINTLKANDEFAESMIIKSDIRGLTADSFKEAISIAVPSKLILIGGPPCQPFSKAGYWITNSARKGVDDNRNMIGDYLRILRELTPDGFIFENVESLLHPTNKKAVDIIISFISKMNYDYKLVKAYALDYGVPQKRRRIFIVGSRKKFQSEEPQKTHCSPENCNSNGLIPYESVGKYIHKYSGQEFFEPEEVTSLGTYAKELEEIPPGKNYFALTERDGYPNPRFKANKRFWSFLLKLHPDMPSWTISAQPGPWVGPFHWTSRRLRVPEIAAIQTFPENYKFIGSRRAIQRQIGNAVPPLMAKTIVQFLKENL
ncbi:DNA cytosine methyltransferase [Chloroflexota bacterium]